MNEYQFDEYIKNLAQQEDIDLPESVRARTEQTLESLPLHMPKRKPRVWRTAASIAACFVILMVGVMPNISVAYAAAVQDIPILGDLVQVFTIRNYFYEDDRHELDAEIPGVNDPVYEEAGALINKDIDELTNAAISKFYQELELHSEGGYGSVYITYETLTNTDKWFTLKLVVSEIQGSSNTYIRYYHIDRTRGNYVTFADLFDPTDYEVLEELVIGQMEAEMAENEEATYWIEDSLMGEDFTVLNDEQNFYFNETGDLVIVYNKYEVAPGSMGCPEFAISFEEYGAYIDPQISLW